MILIVNEFLCFFFSEALLKKVIASSIVSLAQLWIISFLGLRQKTSQNLFHVFTFFFKLLHLEKKRYIPRLYEQFPYLLDNVTMYFFLR